MKVLLINASSHYVKHKPSLPLGLLSIATYLKSNGHTVKLIDRSIDGISINKQITIFAPDIVGISAMAVINYRDAIKISKAVKKMNTHVVWGGHLPSLTPELVLKSGAVDYVVVGEGEITMLALINAIVHKTSLHDIDGLAFLENDNPIVNRNRDLANLKDLPIIDFSFVNPKEYFAEHISCKKMLNIYSTKGCLYNCSYCYNPLSCNHIWRARPTEYFLSEIKYLAENFGMDGVFFADDLFSANREYLSRVCNDIAASGIDFVWGCDMRADICSRADLQMMHDSGCRWIYFGIETGSSERQNKINKSLNLSRIKEVFFNCAEIGIVSITSFIIGFPDETEQELKETVDYMQRINSNVKLPYFFGPVPKSDIYNSLKYSTSNKYPNTRFS